MDTSSGPHFHFHFDGFTGHLEIQPDGSVIVEPASAMQAPSDPPIGDATWSPAIEDLLKRHTGHRANSRSREFVTELVDRGWSPQEPRGTNTYVRCEYSGGRETSIYVRSGLIAVVGRQERNLVRDMTGSDVRRYQVTFPHYDDEKYANAMKVIEKLEEYCNAS